VEDLPSTSKTVSTVQAVAGNGFHWQQLLNPSIVWQKFCERGWAFHLPQVTGGGLTATLLELLLFMSAGFPLSPRTTGAERKGHNTLMKIESHLSFIPPFVYIGECETAGGFSDKPHSCQSVVLEH